MAAFDRICSGYAGLDEVLDSIRLGDNVVWQVSAVEEFRMFAESFVRQAVRDGRNVIYIRFAQHEPVLPDLAGVHVRQFDPDQGFEAFTVEIYHEITRQGREAFYVFDCLSELQSAWYTDLMMGNFFQVTCPYLFELDTVAYFPLIRGRHSFDAVSRIRDTTQLLLDVYTTERHVYLRPLKVWNRHSENMFLPHRRRLEGDEFVAVNSGVELSRYYQVVQMASAENQDQHYDSQDRFFSMAKMEYIRGNFSPETEKQIIDSTMTRDERLKVMVRKYFGPADYFLLRDRMIGSGSIGGKACGMLLARKIAEKEIPEFSACSEPHDSYYIGSDVFYTYIVYNGCWKQRIRQRTPEGYFSEAEALKQSFLHGKFPLAIREQFQKVLDYFGQCPCIVRSSSFLEDGFGNAFAGKYESVFCVNQGDPEERLEAFEQAVRTVYASTMSFAALEYRQQRGLAEKDEQMAVLVQRVSGSYFGRYYMPGAAGVGYSHSAYKWLPDMDQDAGMLRLVAGLGTRAVDRTGEDYPRLVNLDRPEATVHTTLADRHRFSQRNVDVLDCRENAARTVPATQMLESLPQWYVETVMERDYDAEDRLREMGRFRKVWFVSCGKLLKEERFTGLMRKLLKTLERVYENSVDIEYTVNMDETGDFVVNLLQCRPLYRPSQQNAGQDREPVMQRTLFRLRDSSMGLPGRRGLDVVVRIDPKAYSEYPYSQKYKVARALGKINRWYRDAGKGLLLLAPGRIGTSSPDLGVPADFGELSAFSAVCEVADTRAGYMPELSYGSHMFQDMVEADMIYGAIWDNEKTLEYHPEMLKDYPDLFGTLCPDLPELGAMFEVREVPGLLYWLDDTGRMAVCGLPEEEACAR